MKGKGTPALALATGYGSTLVSVLCSDVMKVHYEATDEVLGCSVALD